MKPLAVAEPLNRKAKEMFAWGLANGCPLGDELPTYPLEAVRPPPLRDRFAMIQKMSDHQLDEILAHHTECVGRRQAAP